MHLIERTLMSNKEMEKYNNFYLNSENKPIF